MKTLLIIAGMLLAGTVRCQQQIDTLALSSTLSVLNDRAFFTFPVKALNSARGANLMAADPNMNRETRIVLDIEDLRMVFYAEELFVTTGDDLQAMLSDHNAQFTAKPLQQKDSMTTMLFTPLTFDTTKGAVLVNYLLVKMPDQTVFRLSTYITPKSYKYLSAFQRLSEHVFASVSKGSRRLNFKARMESFPVFDTRHFVLQVPEGYVVTKDTKYDFEVLKLQRVKDIRDTTWANAIIYTGRHPSSVYRVQGFKTDEAEVIKGHLAGKKIEWLYFKNPEKRLYIKEQQMLCKPIGEGIILHVAMLSDSPASIDDLTRLVENIALTK